MNFKMKNGILFFSLGMSIIVFGVYGFEISTEYFRIKNRSKDFKKCTGTILSKPEHGIRVSELTGKCEITTSDDIKEAGYSYAETEIMEKKFTKPVEKFEQVSWNDSKGISPGFRFDMYWSKEDVENYDISDVIKISFGDASHRLVLLFFYESEINKNEENVKVCEEDLHSGIVNDRVQRTMPIVKEEHEIVQLSVLVHGESVKIMFGNTDFLTYQLQSVNINNMHQFTMDILENPFGTRELFFHGYCLSVE